MLPPYVLHKRSKTTVIFNYYICIIFFILFFFNSNIFLLFLLYLFMPFLFIVLGGLLHLSLVHFFLIFSSFLPYMIHFLYITPQDTLGGHFDATQAFVGEISQFNMWDHVLTPAEILGLANCTSHLKGNIIQWEEKLVEVHGGAGKWSFEICKEKMKA